MNETASIRRYQETAVTSVGPERLIVMLYEGLVGYLEQARAAIGAGDRVARTQSISRAQSIVLELKSALDHEVGGTIARNLEALYDFVFHESVAAQLENKAVHLDHCLRVLAPLLDAWRQVPLGTAEQARSARDTVPAERAGIGTDCARRFGPGSPERPISVGSPATDQPAASPLSLAV